jgi:thioredoxin reductase (NADPH)
MYDIIIIGSGPAGLTAAIYASRAQLSTVVVEKDYLGTGQIAAALEVDNYPGYPGTPGYELGENFLKHAEMLGTSFYEGEVSGIVKDSNGFVVNFKNAEPLCGKTIIYATGTSYRKLDIPGGTLLGVSYCATCDGALYKGKNVAVVGGGDTALGDALYLSKIVEKVCLIHRRSEFRGNKTLQEKVKNTPNIELFMDSVPVSIKGKSRVEGIEIAQNGTLVSLDVSGVFTAIGSIPNTSLLDGICELDSNGYVIAGEDGKTSADGIFAAGDVRTKPLRQVITAASDGANCVESAGAFLINSGTLSD